jgi:hypothetical protein
VEPRPGFEPGTSALPGRRSIQAELPRPPLDSLVLGGLICLCVFRVSYICYLLRVSGTLFSRWGSLFGFALAWLYGFRCCCSLRSLFVASFYYVLLRGFGVLPLLSHVSLVLLFIVYTLLFLVRVLVLLLSTTTLTVGFHGIIGLLVVGVMVVAFSSSSLTSLTSIPAPASPRVRVAQAGLTLVPLSGLMLASVSCVLDRVHGVIEDLGLNPLLVSPRVYPCL